METKEGRHSTQLENEHLQGFRNRAIDHVAVGSVMLLWGILLTLKQVGIIDQNVSTWPIALAAFGLLLVAGGIYRLSISRNL